MLQGKRGNRANYLKGGSTLFRNSGRAVNVGVLVGNNLAVVLNRHVRDDQLVRNSDVARDRHLHAVVFVGAHVEATELRKRSRTSTVLESALYLGFTYLTTIALTYPGNHLGVVSGGSLVFICTSLNSLADGSWFQTSVRTGRKREVKHRVVFALYVNVKPNLIGL